MKPSTRQEYDRERYKSKLKNMDRVGEYTLEVMQGAGWYNNWLFKQIQPSIRGRILEVGTGIGNFTGLLERFDDVYGIDVSKRYIDLLNKRYDDKVKLGLGNVETGKYFFKNKKFDTLICLNVLEHINDDQKALKNMHNLLNKGGKLVLLVPAHKILYSEFDKELGHFRRYDLDVTKKKLERARFRLLSNHYLNWWAALGWFVFMKLTGRRQLPKSEVGIFNLLGKAFLWPEKYISPPFGLSLLAVAEKD